MSCFKGDAFSELTILFLGVKTPLSFAFLVGSSFVFLFYSLLVSDLFIMNRISMFFLTVFLIMTAGCSGKSLVKHRISGVYKDAPEWVLASEFSCGVCGSGMAPIDDSNDSALAEAMENARIELFACLNRKIRSCLSEAFKKNRALENEAFARIAESVAAAASERLTTTRTWRSPDNDIFVLVVSDVDVIRDAFKKNMMDFLRTRKPEGIDPESPEIQENIEKLAQKHFRDFKKL